MRGAGSASPLHEPPWGAATGDHVGVQIRPLGSVGVDMPQLGSVGAWFHLRKPVARLVPSSTTAQPAAIAGVSDSPRNRPPHSTANTGMRKVTLIALAGPRCAMRR